MFEERNKIVHLGRKTILYGEQKEKDAAILLLNQAKTCLQSIRVTAQTRNDDNKEKCQKEAKRK